MPILCRRASVSLRLRSKSESSGVISLFCWLSDCSGGTDSTVSLPTISSGTRQHMHVLIRNSNTNLLYTHRCLHGHTHNLSLSCAMAWQKATKHTNNTQECRVWFSTSASCVTLLTFFLTSFFFLSSSFRFFSSLIWARRCFLRSSSAFKSLLSDMVPLVWGHKRIKQELAIASPLWHCVEECRLFGDATVMLQKAQRVWQLQGLHIGHNTAVDTSGQWAKTGFSHCHDTHTQFCRTIPSYAGYI